MSAESHEGTIPLRERVSLAQEWDQFDRTIIARGAGDLQRVEMRRAFYAGAASMFDLVSGGLDADREPTDLDVAYLDSLTHELATFANDLAEGKA